MCAQNLNHAYRHVQPYDIWTRTFRVMYIKWTPSKFCLKLRSVGRKCRWHTNIIQYLAYLCLSGMAGSTWSLQDWGSHWLAIIFPDWDQQHMWPCWFNPSSPWSQIPLKEALEALQHILQLPGSFGSWEETQARQSFGCLSLEVLIPWAVQIKAKQQGLHPLRTQKKGVTLQASRRRRLLRASSLFSTWTTVWPPENGSWNGSTPEQPIFSQAMWLLILSYIDIDKPWTINSINHELSTRGVCLRHHLKTHHCAQRQRDLKAHLAANCPSLWQRSLSRKTPHPSMRPLRFGGRLHLAAGHTWLWILYSS